MKMVYRTHKARETTEVTYRTGIDVPNNGLRITEIVLNQQDANELYRLTPQALKEWLGKMLTRYVGPF